MRTVITISLNGNAYQLDAPGYEALRAYLQVAEQRLAGNPDQMEILADLEQAIADKCGRYLGPHKNVVNSKEITEVLREMGPVDGGELGATHPSAVGADTGTASGVGAGGGLGSGPNMGYGADGWSGTHAGADSASASGASGVSGTGGPFGSGAAPGVDADGNASAASAGGAYAADSSGSGGSAAGEPTRRLYQIREGAFISGVCKGLAAYLNIDVSIVRILFVLLVVLTGGAWILVYIVMMFVIPYAQTSEQHAAAHGWPFNAEELVARAKAHYAQFRESSGKWQRASYREQRRMWRDQRKAWKEQHRAWKRWGAQFGAPPPPHPAWGGAQQPANVSYSAQVANSVFGPLAELLGAVLFILFLVALFSLITHKRILGWWLPHEIPLWIGIVGLIVLYQAIASPLKHARYASYYGAPYARGWLAFFGALIWLGVVIFLISLAWEHRAELQDFLQSITDSWHSMMEHRVSPAESPMPTAAYWMAWGVPSSLLPGCAAFRELQAHGQIDRADVFGEAAEGDVVNARFGDGAYGLQRHAA